MGDVYNAPRRREDGMPSWHRWQDWANLVIGVWLFISPWIVGYHMASISAGWNAWIIGAFVALVSIWALAKPENLIPQVVNAVAGLWLFVAPWLLGFYAVSNAARWESWVLGIAAVVIANSVAFDLRGADTTHHSPA